MLVDSEVISCRVHADVLTRHGYPMSADDVRERFLGRSATDNHADVERELARPLGADYHAELRDELMRALARDVTAMPHIDAALDALDAAVCVASSGHPDKITLTLTRTGLLPRLAPHVFSASQVARGKPAPDLFELAARSMGVTPRRCVVVEDSTAGIAAAIAAGMTPIGFTGGAHCRTGDDSALRAAGAVDIVADMRQLPAVVARHLARA